MADVVVTNKTVQEVLAILAHHNVSPTEAVLDYAGCGTHEVLLTFETDVAPKTNRPRSGTAEPRGEKETY